MTAAIEIEGVTKAYHLNHLSTSLRETVARKGQQILGLKTKEQPQPFLALDGISLNVERGESVGIIGPNGAGKSTILKLVSGVSTPTSGQVKTHGRVSALLELGAGFHPELGGRENIYLKAAILGLGVKETDRVFDKIVDFSGLREFLDTPVKRYSSGMYVRLAFSVVAHMEPEILLVDEVLAVGDARFRKRCATLIGQLLERGTTLVLVSHQLHLVSSICPRSIFLAGGKIGFDGDTSDSIAAYQEWQHDRSQLKRSVRPSQPETTDLARLRRVTLFSGPSRDPSTVRYNAPLTLEVELSIQEPIQKARLAVRFTRSDGVVAALIRTDDYDRTLSLNEGESTVVLELPRLQLSTGRFFAEVRLVGIVDGLILSGTSEWFTVQGIQPVCDDESGFFVPDLGSVSVRERNGDGSSGRESS